MNGNKTVATIIIAGLVGYLLASAAVLIRDAYRKASEGITMPADQRRRRITDAQSAAIAAGAGLVAARFASASRGQTLALVAVIVAVYTVAVMAEV
ncbi:MAG: hypothetical protein RLZZ182_1847 [Pseudomonadota bacterium]|jgi:hypothetical protein